jgi:eukaryotic-like serine/threonine-protein kinase
VRARCALAAAAQGPYERNERLELARAGARRIAADKMPWSLPLAMLIDAGIAHTTGNAEHAVTLLDGAAKQLDEVDLSLYAICARRRIGQLTGGVSGTALLTDADAAMRARAIADPTRFSRMLVPGFPD